MTGAPDQDGAEERTDKVARPEMVEAKDAFLAVMSHEMRTPLNAILGMAELAREASTAEEREEALGIVIRSGESLLRLIDDLLDVSRIEAGELRLSLGTVDLKELVREVELSLRASAKAKSLGFEARFSDGLQRFVRTDGHRLRQILFNLVSNAIRYTESGQVGLSLRLGAVPSTLVPLEIVVRDTGIGIAPEDQSRIFEPFYRAGRLVPGGTGLGLAITRSLVAQLGGTIEVRSTPGVGTTFVVRLPLEKAPSAPTRRNLNRVSTPRLSGSVLVADDHEDSRKLTARVLELAGLSVTQVENGLEAVAAARDGFDLILMDVAMPVLDGVDAARRIRLEESAGMRPRVPILAHSAQASAPDRERCLEAGMDAFIAKPAPRPRLIATVASLLTPGRVLVVDDAPDMRLLLERFLELGGWSAHAVESGAGAVARQREGAPTDIVILDLEMPGWDGFRTAEELRAAGFVGPLIAVTGHSDEPTYRRCLAAGFEQVLVKPVGRRELLSVVSETMRSARGV